MLESECDSTSDGLLCLVLHRSCPEKVDLLFGFGRDSEGEGRGASCSICRHRSDTLSCCRNSIDIGRSNVRSISEEAHLVVDGTCLNNGFVLTIRPVLERSVFPLLRIKSGVGAGIVLNLLVVHEVRGSGRTPHIMECVVSKYAKTIRRSLKVVSSNVTIRGLSSCISSINTECYRFIFGNDTCGFEFSACAEYECCNSSEGHNLFHNAFCFYYFTFCYFQFCYIGISTVSPSSQSSTVASMPLALPPGGVTSGSTITGSSALPNISLYIAR